MANILTNVITNLVNYKAKEQEYGVSIINMPTFDYKYLVENLNKDRSVALFFLGFRPEDQKKIGGEIGDIQGIHCSFDVEKAEVIRNSGDESVFRVLVIKHRDTEKLSSLRWFPEISLSSVYVKSCDYAIKNLESSNSVIHSFIKALRKRTIRNILGFERVLEYLDCLLNAEPTKLPVVLKENLYLLGLCKDSNIDQGTVTVDSIENSIKRNHSVVERIGNLEQAERQSITNFYADDNGNSEIPGNILQYYKSKDVHLLSQMELSDVENCLKSVKSKPSKPKKSKPKKDNTNPTSTAAQYVFDGNEGVINDVLSSMEHEIDNRTNTDRGGTFEIPVGDTTIHVNVVPTTEKIANDILQEEEYYGEIIYAEVDNPADAIDNESKYNVIKFDKNYLVKVWDRLEKLNKIIPEGESISSNLRSYLDLRNKIFAYRKRLQDTPMFPVIANVKLFSDYLISYEKLLNSINEDFPKIWSIAASNAKEIVSTIMALDYIFVLGDNQSTHSVPTPLNPLYLWKYIRLAEEMLDSRDIEETEEGMLSEDDKDFIIRKSEDIPDPLSLMLVPAIVTQDENPIYLPLSGRLGTLPVYSTKRQINQSENGIDTLKKSIIRYVCLYPHSGMMLRLCVIDPPSVETVVSMLKSLDNSKEFSIEGIDLSIYRTKETPSDWLSIDDASLNEGMLGRYKGKKNLNFKFHIHNEVNSYVDILNHIEENIHIMILFDPNEMKVDNALNNRNIHIHPLCVPKVYTYNQLEDSVEIRPSNEGGIFSTYSSIIEKLSEHPSSLSHTSTFFKTPLKDTTYQKMLETSDWLVILDQNLRNWDIMLKSSSEKLYYKEDSYRSIGIYSNNCKKFVRGYNELISTLGNFIPVESGVKNVIESVRDINNDGLLSIVSHTSNRIFDSTHGKGNLGLAIAAITYKQKKNNALLVSMDSQLAREWLSNRDEGILPDLVGINISPETEGLAEIDLIEVKTYRDNPNSFKILEDNRIEGHAVEQVVALDGLMNEIFGPTERITTISRREILREQVFESLFQDKTDTNRKAELSKQLNELFAGKSKITVNKQISFVDFDNDESSVCDYYGTEKYSDIKIRLQVIGRNDIQSIITQSESNILPVKETIPNNLDIKEDDVEESKPDLECTISPNADSLDPTPKMSHIHIDTHLHSAVQEDNKKEIEENSSQLYNILYAFGINIQKIDPTLVLETARFTRYKVEPKQGQSMRAIQSKAQDIAIQMEANGLVMINHIPNTHFISIDIPHAKQFKPLLLSEKLGNLDNHNGHLNVIVGQNAENEIVIEDIAAMPHLLVAGTTGSGKTVFLYSVVVSLMHQYSPDEIQFLIVDPKQTDFTFFEGLPNLYGDHIITDAHEALTMINNINNNDKEERTQLLRESKCRDIISYNQKHPEKKMRRLVVIIDEYADLIAASDNNGNRQEFERTLNMLAQRVRNLGIHLIIATQRPSAKIVTGSIKANFPCRISFRLASHIDSQTILDETGAEDLLGRGDMILKTESKRTRIQGVYISEEDLSEYVSDYIRKYEHG